MSCIAIEIKTDPATVIVLSMNLLFSRVEPGKEVSSPKHGDEDDKEHIGGATGIPMVVVISKMTVEIVDIPIENGGFP